MFVSWHLCIRVIYLSLLKSASNLASHVSCWLQVSSPATSLWNMHWKYMSENNTLNIQEQEMRGRLHDEKSWILTPCFDFVQRSVSNKLLLNSKSVFVKKTQSLKRHYLMRQIVSPTQKHTHTLLMEIKWGEIKFQPVQWIRARWKSLITHLL